MMGSKHLAIFGVNLEIGGVERVLVNLATEFDERDYAVDVVLTQAGGDLLSGLPESVRVIDLDVAEVPGFGDLASVPPLARYLRDAQPDVLLSAKPHTNLFALLAERLVDDSIRTVVSLHGIPSHRYEHDDSHKFRAVFHLTKHLYRWADAIMAVSREVMTDAVEVLRLPEDDFEIVHNPVVSPTLLRRAEAPVDHRWFTAGSPPVVMSAGRLHPDKNYAALLRAFARVATVRDARLLILGEGEERPELESLATELGIEDEVSLPGSVPNPYPYMREASVFVLSSVTEAFPIAIIEAMGCGCPVVATRCSSGPVEILNDGEFGRLVPVNDRNALADAILSSLNEPRRSSTLRERAMDFSVEAITDQYERILFPNRRGVQELRSEALDEQ
jgi:glycosyltransferase involved in cell wall biosynthesis